MAEEKWLGFGRVVQICQVITPIILAIIAFFGNQKAEEINAFLSRQEVELNTFRTQSDFNLKIYDLVIHTLKDSTSAFPTLTQALVTAIVKDSVLQDKLLEALMTARDSTTRSEASYALFIRQDEAVNSAPDQTVSYIGIKQNLGAGNSSNWIVADTISNQMDFDIFQVEETGDLLLCSRIKDLLHDKGYGLSNSFVRVRKLPEAINRRKGYMVDGNQIRYDLDEKEAAEKLREMIRESTGKEFVLQSSSKRTNGYLSIFVTK